MNLLPGKEVANRIRGLILPKYQVHRFSVHLTVRSIYSVDPMGQVDFGGGEYVPAGKIAIAAQRRRTEDRYSWWDLGRGSYFVEFNESVELREDEIALLEPEERLLRAGAAHVPTFLRGRVAPIEALLQVEALRLQIKENARVSRLRIFRFEAIAAKSRRAGSARTKAAAAKPRKKRRAK